MFMVISMKKNSEEYRQKVSDFMKKRWAMGLPNGFKPGNKVNLGKKYSQERIQKIRICQIGKFVSDDSRAKMSLAHIGRKIPKDVIKKRSQTCYEKSLLRVKTETRNNLVRKSIIYKIWRDNVFERDNFTCCDCGLRGGILNAHHLEEFAKNRAKRFEVENGKTYCYLCHRKLHMIKWMTNKYGVPSYFVKTLQI